MKMTAFLKQALEKELYRSLEEEYPVICVDAIYEKIRDDSRVISMTMFVLYGVNLEGKREILAIEPMYDESESGWKAVFEKLRQRGFKKVWLVVSDAHQGFRQRSENILPAQAGSDATYIL
ncbi:MAG: transposase [Spirochaetales bacterium]|nr:transposase [Spirochaetales bacterium]